jgi:methyl-accepting chemotaxis protein
MKKITIKGRLVLAFGILIVIFLALGAISIKSLYTINDKLGMITNNSMPSVNYAHTLNTATSDFRGKELEHIIADNADDIKAAEQAMDTLSKDIENNIELYNTMVINDTDREIINKVESYWNAYLDIQSKVVSLSADMKNKEAMNLANGEGKEAFDKLSKALVELVDFNTKTADSLKKDANESYNNTLLVLIVVIVVAVILSVILSFIITNSIVKPINKLVETANKLALGDVNVNVEVTSKDEIGKLIEAFRKMIDNIRGQALVAEKIADGDLSIEVAIRSEYDLLGKKLYQMVKNNNEVLSNISSAADQVAVGSKQVSDASITLSEGATEQASSIQELTASIEEISSQTQLNAKNANQANDLAVNAKTNAVQGNNQMKEMLTAMEEINISSANISKIIKVIDDIAFQTNILALNAAVEAARAGQHGKGFAVVAEEVRTLAARSANAAKETTDLIEGSIKKVEGGTKIANVTAEALNNIVTEIEKVANLVNDIAIASSEQASGIEQINQGIMQVSQVVQANSATSEESAAASEELSSQAMLLKDSVKRYKLKQRNNSYNQYESLNPEVRKMLDSRQQTYQENPDQSTDNKEGSTDNVHILLSDQEFGKY